MEVKNQHPLYNKQPLNQLQTFLHKLITVMQIAHSTPFIITCVVIMVIMPSPLCLLDFVFTDFLAITLCVQCGVLMVNK